MLCTFTNKEDIVRVLLKAIAADIVCHQFTWKGTSAKKSFSNQLGNTHDLIKDVTNTTFDDDTSIEFINQKIKTHLRHSGERLNRTTGGGNEQ